MRLIVLLLLGSLQLAPSAFAQQAPTSLTPQPLARDVMYRVLFSEISAYQNQAASLAAQSKPNAFLSNYHQKVFQLSPTFASQLIQVALPCAQQVRQIDAQAASIIQAVKSKYKGAGRGSFDGAIPPPPQALADLEKQRRDVILAAADSLADAFGPSQFAYFESMVRQYVGSHFQPAGIPAQAP